MYLYCDEGYTVKYNLILRESPSADPKGLSKGSGCISLYIPTQVTILKFSFTLNGSAAAAIAIHPYIHLSIHLSMESFIHLPIHLSTIV